MISQTIRLKRSPPIYRQSYKLLRLFLCYGIFLLFFIPLGCVKYEIKNIDSQGRQIICFGDSITAGSGVAGEEAYPYLLSEMLEYPVINAGGSGETSTDGLRRLDKDVLAYQPRLVIIEFGGNDYLRNLPLSDTVNNIRKMTERIQAEGAMVAIADISCGIIMSDYRKNYKRLARQTRAIFIPDLLKEVITSPSLKSDYIHPNAKGHQVIAERIYQAIKPYLDNVGNYQSQMGTDVRQKY